MGKNHTIFLGHILDSINAIQSYAAGQTLDTFLNSLKEQDAVIRRLEIIGEAVRKIPEDFKNAHPEVPWNKMAGMRNVLIHEYFVVDIPAVWFTIQDDLPVLKKQIAELYEE